VSSAFRRTLSLALSPRATHPPAVPPTAPTSKTSSLSLSSSPDTFELINPSNTRLGDAFGFSPDLSLDLIAELKRNTHATQQACQVQTSTSLDNKLRWLLETSTNKYGLVYENCDPLTLDLARLGFTSITARELVRDLASKREHELPHAVGGEWTPERLSTLSAVLGRHTRDLPLNKQTAAGEAVVFYR